MKLTRSARRNLAKNTVEPVLFDQEISVADVHYNLALNTFSLIVQKLENTANGDYYASLDFGISELHHLIGICEGIRDNTIGKELAKLKEASSVAKLERSDPAHG
jgi:hypothetical protein